MSDGQVEIGVVCSDPLRLVGLQTILEESAGLQSRAATLEEAAEATDLSAIVLDLSGLNRNVNETLAFLRQLQPEARVVVIGDGLEPGQIQSVIAAGAKGYLPDSADEVQIRTALKVVLDGSIWAPRKVLSRLMETGGVPPAGDNKKFADEMTHRERDVLRLLLDGRNNRQIAETMGIGAVTVKAHMGRMLRKAGVKNRVELTLKALADTARQEPTAKSRSRS